MQRQYKFLHDAVIAYHKRITEARKGQIPAEMQEMKRQVRRENGDQNTEGDDRSNVVNKGVMMLTRPPKHNELETHYSNRQWKVKSYHTTTNSPEVEYVLQGTGKDRDQKSRKGATLAHPVRRQESREVDAGNTREGHRFAGRKQSKTKGEKSSMEDSPYEYLWLGNS